MGGAEKTLKALHDIFPGAPVYTLFYDKDFVKKFMPQAEIRSSFLQKIYKHLGSHKLLTPLLPSAIESLDLSEFDVVISSSVAFSKGLILKPKTRHICYCYSPTRQLWDWHAEYVQELKNPLLRVSGLKFCASAVQHFLRIWDRHASTRVDQFVAISENVRHRIRKYYGRDSTVIYPPVDSVQCTVDSKKTVNCKLKTENYFLIVSRLYKHKNIDIAIRAFNKLEWSLVIIGDGPEYKNLKSQIWNHKNIQMLGFIPDKLLPSYYQNCLAFIMPQEEDFGITPIEAMSYGKPVLALRRGGALEYIEEGVNGEFFEDPVEEVLADGARRIWNGIKINKYYQVKIKETAERFSEERFRSDIISYLYQVLKIKPALFP